MIVLAVGKVSSRQSERLRTVDCKLRTVDCRLLIDDLKLK